MNRPNSPRSAWRHRPRPPPNDTRSHDSAVATRAASETSSGHDAQHPEVRALAGLAEKHVWRLGGRRQIRGRRATIARTGAETKCQQGSEADGREAGRASSSHGDDCHDRQRDEDLAEMHAVDRRPGRMVPSRRGTARWTGRRASEDSCKGVDQHLNQEDDRKRARGALEAAQQADGGPTHSRARPPAAPESRPRQWPPWPRTTAARTRPR